MKTRFPIIKTVRILAIVLLVLLAADWVTAPWWYMSLDFKGLSIGLVRGGFEIIHSAGSISDMPGGWRVDAWGTWVPWRWCFDYESHPGRRYSSWVLYIPLWLPALVLCGVILIVNRLERRARLRQQKNLCPNCHYDRTGIAHDAKCPECGSGGVPA